MINLKVKDYFAKASYWKSFVIKITSFILFVYVFFSFIIFMNSNVDYYSLNLVILFCYLTFLYIFNNIFNFWLFKKCYSLMMKEVNEIQTTTKLPSNLPKVVYVYTTHNDFWEKRMLQNMQQTYKNIEYWISDGSSNKEKSKEIKAFCKKYNVNYHSLKHPSVNKADNLNHFLKYAKVNFDYLLIADSDVIIDKNFVLTSLKYFYNPKFKKLGWVSSLLNIYSWNNWYSYIFSNIDNCNYFYSLDCNFNQQKSSALHSACTLIKKDLLLDFDMQFPESCLEDSWLEFLATKKYWEGFKNPITISKELFDKNILNTFTRVFRIYDWSIKLYKKYYWINLNESKKITNKHYFNMIWFDPLKWIFLPILWSLIIFSFVNYWQVIINHYEYLIIISCIASWFISDLIIKFIRLFRLVKWKSFYCLLINYLYNIAIFWYTSVRFFNSFFKSKYADFTPSRANIKNNRLSTLYKMKKFIIAFFVILILLIALDVSFVIFKWNLINSFLMFIFIYINLLFSWILLSISSFFILYLLSLIHKKGGNNKEDNYIYCKNQKMIEKKYWTN